MSLLDTLVAMKAKVFDIDLELYPPVEGSTLYFLQEDGGLVNYKTTDNRDGMTSGWRFFTNQYQQTKEIQIATMETGFAAVIGRSSHIAFSSGVVYEIDQGSLAPPTKDAPYYTVNVMRTGETFVPQ